MRRIEGQCLFNIIHRLFDALTRQCPHQVQIEVVEASSLHGLNRNAGLIAIMHAAQPLQLSIVKSLNTQTDAIHTRRAIGLETIVLDRAGIRFERDFSVWRQRQ